MCEKKNTVVLSTFGVNSLGLFWNHWQNDRGRGLNVTTFGIMNMARKGEGGRDRIIRKTLPATLPGQTRLNVQVGWEVVPKVYL